MDRDVRSSKGFHADSTGDESIDFQTLLEGTMDMVWLVKVRGSTHHYLYCSPSTTSVLGWTLEEMRGKTPADLYTNEAMAIIADDVQKHQLGEEKTVVVLETLAKDGKHVWLEQKVRVLERHTDGSMTIALYMRDVTDRKLLEDRLEQMAFVDGLTGLDNRRSFDQAIGRECTRALRTALPLSFILLDVDHFKTFNDTYGHLAGDDCLRIIASAVRAAVKRPEDVVARYGGEELAVILPNTGTAGAGVVANRLRIAVRDLRIPHSQNNGRGIVTISGGVATALSSGEKSIQMPEGLLLAADSALYKAKSQGRNQVVTTVLFARTG